MKNLRKNFNMELRPSSEATRRSAAQEFLNISWNPKVHYRVHNSPSTGPYPEPDESSPYYPSSFSKIHFNIILSATSRSS
jgi:hypothetical protein